MESQDVEQEARGAWRAIVSAGLQDSDGVGADDEGQAASRQQVRTCLIVSLSLSLSRDVLLTRTYALFIWHTTYSKLVWLNEITEMDGAPVFTITPIGQDNVEAVSSTRSMNQATVQLLKQYPTTVNKKGEAVSYCCSGPAWFGLHQPIVLERLSKEKAKLE